MSHMKFTRPIGGTMEHDAELAAEKAAREQAERERSECASEARSLRERLKDARRERDEALAELARLQEVHLRGCECTDDEACAFARERDEAREVLRQYEASHTADRYSEDTYCRCSLCYRARAIGGKP